MSNLKSIILRTSLLLVYFTHNFSSIHAVGFQKDTVITLASGRLKPMRKLKVGDEVICYNKELLPEASTIQGIFEVKVDGIVEITTEENITLRVSKTERFFLPQENQWVCAQNLKINDFLLNEDFETVKITNVSTQKGEAKLLVITVDKHHNFLASEGRYLVHNGPLAGLAAYWITKTLCYGTAVAATGAITAGTGGLAGAGLSVLAASSTLGATTGATLVGAAIAGSGCVTEAALLTAGFVSTYGTVAGAAAAVESASAGMGALFALMPFLP